MTFLDKNYWSERYSSGKTGWDIGLASTPLVQYLDQIVKRDISILIPGAGLGHEAVYAWQSGFVDVHILDISQEPLKKFMDENPNFPKANIHQGDFFQHRSKYDLILEQTFFCALDPTLRENYTLKMKELLRPDRVLVGVWFDRDFDFEGPPFGGKVAEYEELFTKHFEIVTSAPCHNSIPERMGSEVFMILKNSKT